MCFVSDVAIEGESVLKLGEDLTFTCKVDKAVNLPVKWTKNNEPLNNNRYDVKNNTLVIMKAETGDAGVYTCTYTSGAKEFSKNVTVGGMCVCNRDSLV